MNPVPPAIDWLQDPRASARVVLACLDLTSLNDSDSQVDVERLCARAQSRFGPVAAVCVWPRLAAFARRQLPAHIGVAAVANFPEGGANLQRALRDTGAIVDSGAQEVDLVLPYARLLAGDAAPVARLLGAVRAACPGLVLKVILETGELHDPRLITQAAQLSLDAGADFLKTSTGKTAVSATPQAARAMLQAIAADPQRASRVGFKASGGIRSVSDTAAYMALCAEILGPQALTPRRFRIGASSLLGDIETVLGATASGPVPAPGGY